MSEEKPRTRGGDHLKRLRAYFIAGLLVLLPIFVTIQLSLWVYGFVYRNLDRPVNTWIRKNTRIDEWLNRMILRKKDPLHDVDWLERAAIRHQRVSGRFIGKTTEGGRSVDWEMTGVIMRNPTGPGFILEPQGIPEDQDKEVVPGLGVVVTIIFLLGIGLFARNYFGHRVLRLFERILDRIPLVRRIYNGAKQVSTVFLQRQSNVFQAVVLVEYPRKGIWTLAFVTQENIREIDRKLDEESVCVFISTTPNPTSGFLVIVRKSELVYLDMTVEDGLKMVISGGVFTPEQARTLNEDIPRRKWRLGRFRGGNKEKPENPQETS